MMADPDHSRTTDRQEIVPRRDPVMWGEAGRPLTAEQVASCADTSVAVCSRLFDHDEVAALVTTAARLSDAADRARDDLIVEPSSSVIRSVSRVHPDGGVFERLSLDRRLAGAARRRLGNRPSRPDFLAERRVVVLPD